MRLTSLLMISTTFLAAAILSLVAATYSVQLVEESSEIGVRDALDDAGLPWAEVQADGLRVSLAGLAPTEALRFQALSAAGSIVDTARIIDEMEVEAQASLAAPRFSAEILRNGSGVSIIGLVPTSTDRARALSRFQKMAEGAPVTDLLEQADYAPPSGWEDAFAFAITAMAQLTRAKASVEAGRVTVTAMAESPEARLAMENKLRRSAPPSVNVTLNISAPRPVITPFTLRFELGSAGAQFDACSADTEAAREVILATAAEAGLVGTARCTIGLGVPSPAWSTAVRQSIEAIAALEGGAVSFADADVTLTALAGTDQSLFDRVVGELEGRLPEVFALRAKLPKAEDLSEGPPEFTATLAPEGQVQLRGRISDAATRALAQSYAQARFGTDKVYMAARVAEDLPIDWSPRVLAGLEALSALNNGAVTVTPDLIALRGNTGNPDASNDIAALFAGKLGEGAEYDIDVVYQEKLDPVLSLPTPEECVGQINDILETGKISFEPGSATIDASALSIMDAIAEVLKQCEGLPLEIQGYTDSQGREVMNQALSQSRAESVLNELRARRVLTSTFRPVGYGEENPIADNKTEEGREANRRIEFWLIRPETVTTPAETTLESAAKTGDTQGVRPEESTGDEQN